jgi:hypothetical protein
VHAGSWCHIRLVSMLPKRPSRPLPLKFLIPLSEVTSGDYG